MFQRIYQKSDLLNNFDVYPIVIPAGKETQIHLRSLGGRVVFQPDTEYQMTVCALDGGDPDDFPVSGDFRDLTARTDAEGAFCFPWRALRRCSFSSFAMPLSPAFRPFMRPRTNWRPYRSSSTRPRKP